MAGFYEWTSEGTWESLSEYCVTCGQRYCRGYVSIPQSVRVSRKSRWHRGLLFVLDRAKTVRDVFDFLNLGMLKALNILPEKPVQVTATKTSDTLTRTKVQNLHFEIKCLQLKLTAFKMQNYHRRDLLRTGLKSLKTEEKYYADEWC